MKAPVVDTRGDRPVDMWVSVLIPRAQVVEVFGESYYRLRVIGPRGERWMAALPQRYCKEVGA